MTRKNSKLVYYIKQFFNKLAPSFVVRRSAQRLLASYDYDAYVEDRVAYYNRLTKSEALGDKAMRLDEYVYVKPSIYYYDLKYFVDRFSPHHKIAYTFGDVITIQETPSIVKSRPIAGDNAFSVVMNLNKIRHFIFSNDNLSFRKKKDALVWRGNVLDHQVHRQQFVAQCAGADKMDVGYVNDYADNAHKVAKMSINQQLKYKFILSIEGNDVASNLKWVMSSNSLCFMAKPKYETWFMEGRLEAGVHYVQVQDDHSDLKEKVDYYLAHEDEAMQIIANANAYVDQFKNKKRERLIGLLVLDKYFKNTH